MAFMMRQSLNAERKQVKRFNGGDVFALLAIITLLYIGVRLAFDSPAVIRGPEISLSPSALPWYTLCRSGA